MTLNESPSYHKLPCQVFSMSSTESADGRPRHAANDHILQHCCGKATRASPTGAAPGSQAQHRRQATEANISKFLGLSGKKSGEINMHVVSSEFSRDVRIYSLSKHHNLQEN